MPQPTHQNAALLEALPKILREAATIISEIRSQNAPPSMRYPIVDELEGFAGMVDELRASPAQAEEAELQQCIRNLEYAIKMRDDHRADLVKQVEELKKDAERWEFQLRREYEDYLKGAAIHGVKALTLEQYKDQSNALTDAAITAMKEPTK